MNFKVYWAAVSISAVFLFSVHARAMSIEDFVLMNNDDEATYVTSLVEGASKFLKVNGHPDLADKAIALFNDSGKNGGVNQFANNLRTLNTLNNRNATNPNNRMPVYEVEDAMEQTLKDAGITIPVSSLVAIGKDFRPTGPRRQMGNQ